MNLYVGMIVLTELMMLALTLHVVNYTGFTRVQKAWFLLTFLSTMLCAAAECIAIEFDARGAAFSRPLTVLTEVQFALTPMLPVFFAGALGVHNLAKWAGALLSVNVLAEVILAPFGWIFYYDAMGTYIRGPYYIIYQIFYIVSLIIMVVCMIVVGRRFRHRDFWTIFMVFVVMAAGILPLILFKIYTDYPSIAMSAVLCYIYYNDLVQQDIQMDLTAEQAKVSAMQVHIISGLANLIESRDVETGEHASRTSAYVQALAEHARADGVYADALDERFIIRLRTLAPMHDIGKIVVSDQILKKPGELTPEEFEQMKKHASAGGTVIREVLNGIADEEYLNFASDVATYHHERWDGTGYPKGLAGEDIPLSARIMAIADVFDALISERCYKKAMPVEEAFEVIREESGTHFDPKLAEVFLNHKEDFVKASRS